MYRALEEEFPFCWRSQALARKMAFAVEICQTLVRKSLDDRSDDDMRFGHSEEAVESHSQALRLYLDRVREPQR
jgi:hypothetical protein